MPLLVVLFVHFEHDPVTPVIRNINMKQAIGSVWYHPEIEFSYAVRSFNQSCKAYIFRESEVHGVQFGTS